MRELARLRARHQARRLSAEEFWDAISDATGVYDIYELGDEGKMRPFKLAVYRDENYWAFLRLDYPDLQIILAYNTPHPLPVEAELQEALADAVGLAVDEIPCTERARPFFDSLVEFARGLDNGVREVPQARSVVYRTPAWFVELLPRVNRVIVRLALDPEEGIDITNDLESASDWEFIVNSVVTGGSIFRVRDEGELAVAKRLIHRAHQIAIAE